ncbi:MAG: hypothetical protein ACFFED_09990 [Candidatus Thorarchaeota archaeon]
MSVLWGSRKWQVLSAIFIVLILGYGTIIIIIDVISGHPLWWYNLTYILFGLALFGLLLLVREGYGAFSNLTKYGLHPDKEKILKEREEQRIADRERRVRMQRSIADNYPDDVSKSDSSSEGYDSADNYLEDQE